MTGVDIVILLITLISVVIGVMRGFVKEVLTIISLVVSIWLSITFSAEVGEYINNNLFTIPELTLLPSLNFQEAAGGVVAFIVLLLIFAVVNYLLHKLLVQEALVGADRTLGAMLGLFRAVIIVAAVMVLGRSINMHTNSWWQSSKLIAHLEPSADILQDLLPSGLQPIEQPVEQQALDVLNSIENIEAAHAQEVN